MKKREDKCSNCGSTKSKTFWDYPDGKILCDNCEHTPAVLRNIKKIPKYYLPILLIIILIILGLLTYAYLENNSLKQAVLSLDNDKVDLNTKIIDLNDSLNICQQANETFNTQYQTISNEYSGAYKVPYVVMRGRTATAVFKKLNGEIISWEWPATAFEEALRNSYVKKTLIPETFSPLIQSVCTTTNTNTYNTYKAYFSLCEYSCTYFNSCDCRSSVQSFYDSYISSTENCNQQIQDVTDKGVKYKLLKLPSGTEVSVLDYTEFVDSTTFKNVINTIYDSTKSDEDNIKEIFNVNSQLITYSSELGGVPRYSLETLSEGGGDCGAKAVLVASLLKAVPRNWKVQLIYMDSDNPTNPKKVNHAIVFVDTGTYSTYIETTVEKDGLTYWTQQISGWSFDV